MRKVHRQPFYGTTSPCGERVDFGLSIAVGKITCHGCLEAIVREGEAAVARIVELDRTAGEVGKPAGPLFVDCDCGASWHHKNDIPCQRKRIQQAHDVERASRCDCKLDWAMRLNTKECPAGHNRLMGSNHVLVHHAVTWLCHGMVVIDGRCPMCATRVDLQSSRFWRVEDAKFRV